MKRILFLFAIFLCISLILSACELPDFVEIKKQLKTAKDLETIVSQQNKELYELKEKFGLLDQSFGALKLDIIDLESRLSSIMGEMEILKAIAPLTYKSANFDPNDSTFQRIDTGIGTFAISIQDVKPHANGVKVRLHVGNLTTATINGGTLKVQYGPKYPPTEAGWSALAEYFKKNKDKIGEKDIKFLERLQPGVWNNVTVSLPGISPQELGRLTLSMEITQISMIEKK